jgi:hypothetical protein
VSINCLQSRAKKHAASDLPCNFWSNPALSPRKIALDDRFAPIAPFPASVTCEKIKVQVYGQASQDQPRKVPVTVSVGTSPLLNRASSVQPPYNGRECAIWR